MWRTRLTIAAAALAGAAGTGGSSVAHAGALAEVTSGLAQASGQDPNQPKGNGSSSGDGHSVGDVVVGFLSALADGSGGGGGGGSCCSIDPYATLGVGYAPPPSGGGMSTELYLGAQSVENSNGAMTLEARAIFQDFGLGVRGTSYFEQIDARKNEYLRLDLWWVGGFWRVDQGEKSSIWLELGVTGLDGPGQVAMTGAAGGLRFQRALFGLVGVTGGVRHFWYQHSVHANELHAAVQLSIVRFGYRLVDFNVGPPLHGPEAGVAFEF